MIKSLMIGIDGATFDVINPLIKQKKLPNLKKLIEEGVSGICRSTIPPVTGAAWPSLLLSQGPGKHGVFSFFRKDLTEYGQVARGEDFVTSEVLAHKTFLDQIAKKGGRVGLITVPMTYPTWELNGIIVSGYPCPDTKENFVHQSKDIKIKIKEPLNFSASYYESVSLEQLEQDEYQMIQRRGRLVEDLLKDYDFDCLMMVFGATDRAQHEFWRFREKDYPATKEERTKFKDTVDKTYQTVDQAIGGILKQIDQSTNVFIVSDHGGGPKPKNYFNVNRWLQERGDLKEKKRSSGLYSSLKRLLRSSAFLRKTQDKMLEISFFQSRLSRVRRGISAARFDWEKTKAYFYKMEFPSGGIVINLQERQKMGIVKQEDYEKYRDALIKDLQELKDQKGQKVIREIYKREDFYSGEFTKDAPDIIFVVNDWCLPDSEIRQEIFSPVSEGELKNISGLHRMEGVFVAFGPAFKKGKKVERMGLIDVGVNVLASMGISIPEHMDGEVKKEIFAKEIKEVKEKEKDGSASDKKVKLSSEEEDQIKKKLERLGYL